MSEDSDIDYGKLLPKKSCPKSRKKKKKQISLQKLSIRISPSMAGTSLNFSSRTKNRMSLFSPVSHYGHSSSNRFEENEYTTMESSMNQMKLSNYNSLSQLSFQYQSAQRYQKSNMSGRLNSSLRVRRQKINQSLTSSILDLKMEGKAILRNLKN